MTQLLARLRRIFLASSLLNILCIALIIILAPQWARLPLAVTVGLPAVLAWSLAVTAYSFFLQSRLSDGLHSHLRERSYQDMATGVLNYRYLCQRLQEEGEVTRRHGGTMSVLYMDLDGFKGVNDRFGHETGNIVLKQVATMLSQRVRLCDVFGRAGGDEFVVMLPRTEQKEAYVLAERLREAVEDYRLQIDNEQAVDCVRLSVGVAGFPADGRSIKEVVRAADDAVYAAKAKGGNRVCIAGEESVEEPEPGQEVLSGGRTRVDGRTEV